MVGGNNPNNPVYNPEYNSYANNDCANFASQCLIAGYYEDITFSSYANSYGCIINCSNLNAYLTSKSDVGVEVIDFHQNGWENGNEPNNHIPSNFTIGDVAIIGYHSMTGDHSGHYKHAIICCKIENNIYYFGAHTNNRINKKLSFFIDSDSTSFDYATFYHIDNSWNYVTPISGGEVSGIWRHSNSTYCINGDINIPLDSTLTIEGGVDVVLLGHYSFDIFGKLVVEGTKKRWVNFTAEDTTNGWRGLAFIDQNPNSEENSTLEYAKISYGKANEGYPHCNGGGIFCQNSNPSFYNCIISHCSANGSGGGIFLLDNSNPEFYDCIIEYNSAQDTGGGLFIFTQNNICAPMFVRTMFLNNFAEHYGTAIACQSSYQYNYQYSPVFINSTISGNRGNGFYDPAHNYDYNPPSPISIENQGQPTFYNSIIWNNGNEDIAAYLLKNERGSSNIDNYSIDANNGNESYLMFFYNGYWGNITYHDNILDEDPLFNDPANDDYSLKPLSPCIDMGGYYSTYLQRDTNMPAELKQRLNKYFASRSTDPDGTTPDLGAIAYYQPDYVNTPQNITIHKDTSNNIVLNWDESEGAIFYNIYYGTTPYSITDTLSTCVRALTYTDTIPAERKFYIVKGGNNRTSQHYFTTKTNITNKKSDIH